VAAFPFRPTSTDFECQMEQHATDAVHMGVHRNFSGERKELGDMASTEREPITGFCGGAPAVRGPRGRSPTLNLKALEHLHF